MGNLTSMAGVLKQPLIHAICTYYGQWLPGDERGWRSPGHRIHSSGDYTNPPPSEEHAGLRRWVRARMKSPPVRLRADQIPVVGSAFIDKMFKTGCEVRVLACGATHLHVLFASPQCDVMPTLGKAKQYSSLKLADHRGQLWAGGAKIIRIRNWRHAERVFNYICSHALKESAWTWRCDEDAPPPSRV